MPGPPADSPVPERRGVIPMTLFYEWGPGIGGWKQAHEFHDPEDDYLWVAGIWEENPDFGPCYSMVTTGSSPVMTAVPTPFQKRKFTPV